MRSNLGRFHRPMSRGLVNNMLTMNNLGDGSTLSLDFTAMGGVLDPRLTFSRASTATFVNSSGYVQFATANLFRHSENTTSWSGAQSITSTANAAIAPNGTLTADQLNFGSGDYFYNTTAVTNPVGQKYVGSVWMRTVSGTASVGLRITNNVTGANSSIATCSVTETWQRFNTTALTLTDTANRQIDVGVDQRSIVSGPAVSANIYIWGLQLQPGASVGEYLPTTTTENYSTPRFDYSPTTVGSPNGLLIEGAATNLTKFSETFTNAYWNTTANNVTAADSVATSPTGVALTASTLTEIAGTVSRHVHQLVGEFTPAASTAYTMSCFVKQPTSNAIRYVQFAFWSAGFGLTAYMNYDLQTGTVGTGGAGITASSITPYPNGWYRITARATSVAVPGVSGFQLGFSTTSGAVRTESYTASAPLKSIQLFGAQVEIGSGASSYISTGASQVTRNADECRMTGTNFSSWFAGATEGVFFAEYEKPRKLGSQDYVALSTVYAAGALLNITTNTGTLWPSSICWPTGGALFPGGITTACPAVTKRAIRWFNGNDFSNFADGVLGTTSNGTGTLTMTMLNVGATTNTGTSSTADWLNSCIKKIKFYPTALPNADIQTLTAP